MNRMLACAAAAAVSLFFAATATATPIFDPKTNNCQTRNCRALVLGGIVNGFVNSAVPWVVQVFATRRQCLRLEVTGQEADLEMRVVAPDGTRTFFNDDSGLAPCPLCPLVKINRTPQEGFYTVQISHHAGISISDDFTLAYGRYPRGNPNCTSDTLAPKAAIKKGDPSPAPDSDSPPGN